MPKINGYKTKVIIQMIREKELPGTKTRIKLEFQKVKPIRPESWLNLPKQFRKKSDGLSKSFKLRIWVDVKDIDTKEKLAFVTRKYVGFGEKINILGWSKLRKNRFYNPRFKCYLKRNKECKFEKKCKLKSIHKKGWSCLANRKYNPNWVKRATVRIMPGDFLSEKDYIFKFDKRSLKMHYYWFWKE